MKELKKTQTLKRKIIQSSVVLLIALFAVAYIVLLALNINFINQQDQARQKTYEDWCSQELSERLSVADKAISMLRIDSEILEMFQRNLYDLDYTDSREKIKDTIMLRETTQQICAALEIESIVFFIPYEDDCPTGLIDEYIYSDALLADTLGEKKSFLGIEGEALEYNYGLTDEAFWKKITGSLVNTQKGTLYTTFYLLTNYSRTEYYGCVAISLENYVVSQNISALYGSAEEYVLTIKDAESGLVLYSNGDTAGGDTFFMEEYGLEITQRLKTNSFFNTFLVGLIVLIVMTLSCWVFINVFSKMYKRVFSDIYDYIAVMDNMGETKPKTVPQYEEFITISEKFNQLIENLNGAIREKSLYEVAQKEAQLMSLQYQINPHFMFNMLEVFRMRLESCGDIEAAESMRDFGQFLRYNLHGGEHSVTIDEEIRMAERFIGLFRFKYADRLTVEVHVPEELKRMRCIKFILQPLVENSIKYGFQGKNKLHIIIECFIEDKFIVLRVIDNGCGIEKKRLEEIRSKLDLETSEEYSIGLSNVCRRIKLFYGERGRFIVNSEEGKGTCVEIAFTKEGGKYENSID